MKREFRKKIKGLNDLLNYAALVDEGICLLKDGSLMAAFSYRGPDLTAAENTTLEQLSAYVNQTLIQLGDGWMLQVDMIRIESREYPTIEMSHFQDATSFIIDAERREHYLEEGAHFESKYVMSFTYQTPTDGTATLTKWFIQNNQETTSKDKTLLFFQEALTKIENALSHYLNINRLTSEELLTHLHMSITGLTYTIKLPHTPVYLDTLLATQDFTGGLAPRIGNYHILPITLTGLPLESEPGILSIFENVPLKFRWQNRFIFLNPNTASRELKIYRRNWFQKRHGVTGILREAFNSSSGAGFQNQDALRETADADTAIAEADSGFVRYGYYTSSLILMDADYEKLHETAQFVLKQLALNGVTGRIETVNAIETYLGSLPGHGHENIRKPLIHTLNLADLLPLTSTWAGLEYNPCRYYPKNSSPLLFAKTTGNTPFRLHLHDNDVAHTLIVGATGTGKSTLVLTTNTQFFRYKDAQVFLFDKGYSSYILCRAMRY